MGASTSKLANKCIFYLTIAPLIAHPRSSLCPAAKENEGFEIKEALRRRLRLRPRPEEYLTASICQITDLRGATFFGHGRRGVLPYPASGSESLWRKAAG